jgi:hypothetical protein
MKRPLLTEQNIVDHAEARKWRNSFWTDAYRVQRRIERVWISVFLLLFSLVGALLVGILMVAKYGRP